MYANLFITQTANCCEIHGGLQCKKETYEFAQVWHTFLCEIGAVSKQERPTWTYNTVFWKLWSCEFPCMVYLPSFTPLKFKIAPENRPSQKDSSFPTTTFQGRAVKLPWREIDPNLKAQGIHPTDWWIIQRFLAKNVHIGVEPKIGGFYPKMDGLFHGKPY